MALLVLAALATPAPAQQQQAGGESTGAATAQRFVEVSDHARPLPEQIRRRTDGGLMRLVPAGEFFRGSNDPAASGGDPDESPMSTVFLNTFYIDQFEVTNSQYQQYMDATGRPRAPFMNAPGFSEPTQPVVGLTWQEAAEYARWAGARLPSEAEWEKAARGVDARLFPWGNELAGNEANTRLERRNSGPARVGSFPRDVSPYGVFDMAGNVSEWVLDWYDATAYTKSEVRNPTGPLESTGQRVLRGGNYDFEADKARTISRLSDRTDQSRSIYGFRLAFTPGAAPAQPSSANNVAAATERAQQQIAETPVEQLWEAFERLLFPAFENHRPLPPRLGAEISDLFPARTRRDVHFINLTDASMYLTVVTDDRRVVVYDQAVRRSTIHPMRLPVGATFRFYGIVQDESPVAELLGIFEIPEGSQPLRLVSSLEGRFRGDSMLKLAAVSMDANRREIALVNRTDYDLLYTVSDMGSPGFGVTHEVTVRAQSFEMFVAQPGEYRVVARYVLMPMEFGLTEVFSFDDDAVRHTIVASPAAGAVGEYPRLEVRRSVYVP